MTCEKGSLKARISTRASLSMYLWLCLSDIVFISLYVSGLLFGFVFVFVFVFAFVFVFYAF